MLCKILNNISRSLKQSIVILKLNSYLTQHNQYAALIYLLMEKHKKQNQAFFISIFPLDKVKMMVAMASHEAPPISSTCTVLSSVSSVSELRAMR